MIDRFLKYSLEREKKISAVWMEEGKMIKKNLQVVSIDANGQGFFARLPGRKKEIYFLMSDLLTCAYARGDQGELESL